MSFTKKVFIGLLCNFFISISVIEAQWMLGGGYQYQYKTLITTQQFSSTSDINGEQGWEVQIGRRFQIGERQLFFMPMINYGQGERLKVQYGATGWIVIYPLIFNEDCDCPTFGSKTSWFDRSFNIAVGPTFQRTNYGYSDTFNTYNLTGLAPGLSMSMGWDIPLTSKWYIQPFLAGTLLFDASIFELTPNSAGATTVDYVNTENYTGVGGIRLRF
ncbi:MAG: hypothetical protein ACO388_04910 [Saprospiraceae bacterium]|jgi:hypothetical protein